MKSASSLSLCCGVASGAETRLGGEVVSVDKVRPHMGRAMRGRKVLEMCFKYTRFAWKLWEFAVKSAVYGLPLWLAILYWMLPPVLLVPVSVLIGGVLAGIRPAEVVFE